MYIKLLLFVAFVCLWLFTLEVYDFLKKIVDKHLPKFNYIFIYFLLPLFALLMPLLCCSCTLNHILDEDTHWIRISSSGNFAEAGLLFLLDVDEYSFNQITARC